MKTIEFKNAPEILTIEGPFNTFRLGTKWMDIHQGLPTFDGFNEEEAYLRGLVDGADIGRWLRPEYAYTGPLWEMLNKHAGRNHATQGDQWSSGPTASAYALKDILGETYGADKVSDDEVYTVLYLTRI